MTSTPITAIPTRYAGCHFRSRLEARWAVFFDHLDISWQYEPQGYLVDGKPYLPDFHLPSSDIWVEVKGTEEDLLRNQERVVGAAFALGKLLILGPIPDVRDGIPFHAMLESHPDVCLDGPGVCLHLTSAAMLASPHAHHSRSVCTQTAAVTPGGPRPELPPWEWLESKSPGGYTCPNIAWGLRGHEYFMSAYMAARSARFEHGESGA